MILITILKASNEGSKTCVSRMAYTKPTHVKLEGNRMNPIHP